MRRVLLLLVLLVCVLSESGCRPQVWRRRASWGSGYGRCVPPSVGCPDCGECNGPSPLTRSDFQAMRQAQSQSGHRGGRHARRAGPRQQRGGMHQHQQFGGGSGYGGDCGCGCCGECGDMSCGGCCDDMSCGDCCGCGGCCGDMGMSGMSMDGGCCSSGCGDISGMPDGGGWTSGGCGNPGCTSCGMSGMNEMSAMNSEGWTETPGTEVSGSGTSTCPNCQRNAGMLDSTTTEPQISGPPELSPAPASPPASGAQPTLAPSPSASRSGTQNYQRLFQMQSGLIQQASDQQVRIPTISR